MSGSIKLISCLKWFQIDVPRYNYSVFGTVPFSLFVTLASSVSLDVHDSTI